MASINQHSKPKPSPAVTIEGNILHAVWTKRNCWYESADEWRAQLATVLNFSFIGFIVAEITLFLDYFHGPEVFTLQRRFNISGSVHGVIASPTPQQMLEEGNLGRTAKTAVSLSEVVIHHFATLDDTHRLFFNTLETLPRPTPMQFGDDLAPTEGLTGDDDAFSVSTRNIAALEENVAYSNTRIRERSMPRNFKKFPTGHPKQVDTSKCRLLEEVDISDFPLPSLEMLVGGNYQRRAYGEFWRDVMMGRTCPDVRGDLVVEFVGTIQGTAFNMQYYLSKRHPISIKRRYEERFCPSLENPSNISMGDLIYTEGRIPSSLKGAEREAFKVAVKDTLKIDSIKLFDTI